MKQTNKNILIISALLLAGGMYAQTDYSAPASATLPTGTNYNTIIGGDAGTATNTTPVYPALTGARNALFGTWAGSGMGSGSNNCYMGYESAYGNNGGSYNVAIGYGAGTYAVGSSNIFIGYGAGAQNASNTPVNNKLYIDIKKTESPLIGGDFSARTVSVNGEFYVGPAAAGSNTQIKSDGLWTTIDQLGTGTGGILLNYLSGKDVNICTNWGSGLGNNGNGGYVNMGYNVNIGGAWPQSSTTALNIRSNGGTTGTAINIQTPTNAPIFTMGNDGTTIINSTSSSNSPFKIINSTLPTGGPNAQTAFEVTASGQVYIGAKRANGVHAGAMLSVYGEVDFTSAYVNALTWADYVFDKNYKLLNLNDVEIYYLQNHHLPGVPSAKEMEKTGDNIAETDAILLKKIEELTIYMVEQQKKMKELEDKLEKLNK